MGDAVRNGPKRLPDGRAMLNLGCAAQIAEGWENLDFSWLVRLSRYTRLAEVAHSFGLLDATRLARLRRVRKHVRLCDLRNGVPFPNETFDVVYHSHVLEHIPREIVPAFLRECVRILRRGGILRIVVPDLELLARSYLRALTTARISLDREARSAVSDSAAEIFDQMIVRRPRDRMNRHPIVQLIEDVLVGNTARSGTAHRWMWDEIQVSEQLEMAGLTAITRCGYNVSAIDGWSTFGLDENSDGTQYKANSLYMEARRP